MANDLAAAYVENAKHLLADPDSPKHLTNHYTFMSTMPRNPAQAAIAKRAFNLAPLSFITRFNYASALSRAGHPALGLFRQALELAEGEQIPLTLHHIGLAHHDLGEYVTALHYYERAKQLDPERHTINQSIAIAKLTMGRLHEGLTEFEVIHHVKPRKEIPASKIPWWNGENLEGKRVIVTHEQGFGDTLQFIRFVPLLKARCRHLVFSGHESLAPLIAEQFDCFDDVINEKGPFKADFVTSPMAATALMGIEYDHISPLAYMQAEPLKLPPRGKLKVGLSWKGSPQFANDGLRSASLADFTPLFDLPGAAFYSLQMRPAPTEIAGLGLDGFIGDLGSDFKDWRDTARAAAAMDVIVATDSANAHIAGAIGKPVLLLLGRAPCWRWMTGDRTLWYSGHRIFRQKSVDNWPMAEVRAELERMIG